MSSRIADSVSARARTIRGWRNTSPSSGGPRLGEPRHDEGDLGQYRRARPAGIPAVRVPRQVRRVHGHSLGGHNAVFTAVFDDRIQAIVTCCGLDSAQPSSITPAATRPSGKPEQGWARTRYMPKLAAYRGKPGRDPLRLPRVDRSPRPSPHPDRRPAQGQQLPLGERRPDRRCGAAPCSRLLWASGTPPRRASRLRARLPRRRCERRRMHC